MKIDVDQVTIDKLIKKRVTEFNKQIRSLETKLTRRDNKIKRLEKEIERLKADLMDTQEGTACRIAQFAEAFVAELRNANWVHSPDGECWNCGTYQD